MSKAMEMATRLLQLANLEANELACCMEHSAEELRRLDAENAQLRAELEAIYSAEPWQAFDYANPPDDGVMWVAVASPGTDCDVDDYGRTFGWHTGETEYGVCMVLLTSDGEGGIEFDALNDWELGRVPADGVVTHFAPVKRPRHPLT